MRNLIVGSRQSLLAKTQSQLVIKELKKQYPRLKLSLKTLATEGDKKLETALWQMGGKDFWVKELDTQLIKQKVHLVIHSLKDLSLTRPTEIQCGAILMREDPRDLIIVRRNRVPNKKLKIGTSSPRRIEQLALVWPKLFAELGEYDPVILRGNVPTRIHRLSLGASDSDSVDGICIAAAGLIRLLRNKQALQKKTLRILQNSSIYVLPVHLFPSAPGQGALAVECRSDDSATLSLLKTIHCADTAADINVERKVLSDVGGGCHSPLGVTVVGQTMFVRYPGNSQVTRTPLKPRQKTSLFKNPLYVGQFSNLNSKDKFWDPLTLTPQTHWEVEWAKLKGKRILVLSSQTAAQIIIQSLHDQLRFEIAKGTLLLASVGPQTYDVAVEFGLTPNFVGLNSGKRSLVDLVPSILPDIQKWTWVYASGERTSSKIKNDLPRRWIHLSVYEKSKSSRRNPLPTPLSQFDHFVFSSYSCFEAFRKEVKMTDHDLQQFLNGKVSIRTGGSSLEKMLQFIPNVTPWIDEGVGE